ncbi:acyl-CoA thioesterase [Gordonia sp. CPCC 205333]|uniref:acyl-CoA thioesterase n=1 Tax=Gordonia sp. CPCC 205333 TaxID=3140790 RepID=UPI003AF3A709
MAEPYDEPAEGPGSPHCFDAAIELRNTGAGTYLGSTTPAYGNVVGPFGGITAATLLNAVMQHPGCLGGPLTLTVNYAGPITPGTFDVAAQLVRTNRSTQHWNLALRQNAVVATTATAIFGTRRQSWTVTEITPPVVPSAQSIAPAEFSELVGWMGSYETRFVSGDLSITQGPQENSGTTFWINDKRPRAVDYLSLTALSDACVPRVMQRLGRFVPAATISLTVYFHAESTQVAKQADRPVLATARAHHFGSGLCDQTLRLWSDDSTLLVTGHQLVSFRAE